MYVKLRNEAERSGIGMKKLLAGFAVLVTASLTGCFGVGSATADDWPVPGQPTPGTPTPAASDPGTAYALGGAHVLGIPYDEYIRRTGADWFPGMKREKVDYPAGQVQGHVLERLFPGIGRVGEEIYPGIGLDGPSIGESVDDREAKPRDGHPQRWPREGNGVVRGSARARRREGTDGQ